MKLSQEKSNWSSVLSDAVSGTLIPLLETLLKKADDTLFDMSERATSSDEQQRFFDAMRDLRVSQKLIVAAVIRGLRVAPSKETSQSQSDEYDLDSLSLIDDAEMEETVALESMSARAIDQGAEAFSDYKSRMEEWLEDKFKPNQVPLGPHHIAQSFLTALKSRDYDVTVTLILFKLFERNVGAKIDEFYEEANQLLIAQGVLPDLKTRKKQQRRASSRSSDYSDDEESGGVLGQLLQALQGVPIGSMPSGGGAQGGVGGILSGTALANGPLVGQASGYGSSAQAAQYVGGATQTGTATSAVGASEGHSGMSAPPVALAPSPNLYTGLHQVQGQVLDMQMSPQQVSQQLHSQMQYSAKHHSAEVVTHGAVINLVALLFDFILEDHHLQAEMKQLIARLQVPFVKVALIDKGFFENNHHPARELLNRLADIATGWNKEEDEDELYDKLEACVHGVLRDFDEDVSLFETSLKLLEESLSSKEEEQQKQEANVVKLERTRTIADAATKASKAIISRVLSKHPVSPSFQPIISQAWLQVLFRLYYKQGGSKPWRQACKVANALAWSLQTESAVNREYYEKTTQQVMQAVRKGLSAIQYSHPQLEERLSAIEDFWHRQLLRDDESANDGLGISEFDEQASLDSLELGDQELDDVLISLNSEETSVAEMNIEERWLDIVQSLKPGAWCEHNADDQWLRIKLADILPQSGRYLFVNRVGAKQLSLAQAELAQSLKEGQIRLIENGQLFDRALSSVIESLRIAI